MRLRLLALFAAVLLAGPLAAAPTWTVERDGAPGKVLLLGSVHMLQPADLPLPGEVQAAYARAGRVVLELAPQDLSPEAAQAALQRIGVTAPGRSSRELLGEEDWRRAEGMAETAGVRAEAVAPLEPWFAALVIYTGKLAGAGFDAALGVDRQVIEWSLRDGLPASGLETLEEQLMLFKGLDDEMQREILLKTLEESGTLPAETAALIAAWREGDIGALAATLEQDFQHHAMLRDRLVGDRNRRWLPEVAALLDEPGTSLVVVGALHLVGPEGLPALLEEAGFGVRRGLH